jgi:probable HAF family extracellular repeat protein
MKARRSPLSRAAGAALIALATFTVSCREGDEPTAPQVQAATGGATTTVTSVVPDSAKRGLNLDITVHGSGFDQGSVVGLERQGVPAAGITTNATTFITPGKLIANITIAADADTGKYDVAVTTSSGRKGVGIELFAVLYELVDVGVIAGNWSTAVAINDLGQVVGASCIEDCHGTMDPPSPTHAFFWTESGGIEDLGALPGYSRSTAYDINNLGQVLGDVGCWMSDAGCGGTASGEVVLWQKAGDQWTVARLGIPLPAPGIDGDMNNSGQFVMACCSAYLYSLTGGLAVGEALPPLDPPPAVAVTSAINDAGIVAGQSYANDGSFTVEALVWFRDQSGTWRILRLGALPGHNISLARDIGEIDAAGRIRVVGNSAPLVSMHGRSRRNSGYHPVRWTLESDGAGGWRVAEMEELQLPHNIVNSDVLGVNTAGEVVGDYFTRQIIYDAATWSTTGSLETLPKPGFGAARARDIDNAGRIVGSVWDDATASERAALWRQQ